MQFNTCMLKGTEELKGAKILWKLKTCEVLHNLLNSEKVTKSILKLTLQKFWNPQYIEELKSFKWVNFNKF